MLSTAHLPGSIFAANYAPDRSPWQPGIKPEELSGGRYSPWDILSSATAEDQPRVLAELEAAEHGRTFEFRTPKGVDGRCVAVCVKGN